MSSELERLRKEVQEANKLMKQLTDLNDLNHRRFMAMRARLAVLTVLHRTELEGLGFNIDHWIKELELTPQQLRGITLSLKHPKSKEGCS